MTSITTPRFPPARSAKTLDNAIQRDQTVSSVGRRAEPPDGFGQPLNRYRPALLEGQCPQHRPLALPGQPDGLAVSCNLNPSQNPDLH